MLHGQDPGAPEPDQAPDVHDGQFLGTRAPLAAIEARYVRVGQAQGGPARPAVPGCTPCMRATPSRGLKPEKGRSLAGYVAALMQLRHIAGPWEAVERSVPRVSRTACNPPAGDQRDTADWIVDNR